MSQHSLFTIPKETSPVIPAGFKYEEDLITPDEERTLAEEVRKLPLKPFNFHGHIGHRRVASFGLRYDYSRRKVELAEEPPSFIKAVLPKIATFAGMQSEDFRQIGINEYSPGAGIGWHRDKPQFEDIVGISLLASVKMRFRKRQGEGWKRISHLLTPRSAYLLRGEARQVWEHSIAPMASLRYSLTFRTLRCADDDFNRSIRYGNGL